MYMRESLINYLHCLAANMCGDSHGESVVSSNYRNTENIVIVKTLLNTCALDILPKNELCFSYSVDMLILV